MIKIDIEKHFTKGDEGFKLDISLDIQKGEFLALSGASGSGKTTLLRVIAGLQRAKGIITVDGKVWQDESIYLSTQHREIGFVFQDYALFPNMSVEDNLLYVQKDYTLAKHLLDITQLVTLKDKYPDSLSGGQKQRVALCRALMRRPKILLLDEPFSALDLELKQSLYSELLQLHKEFGITTIMASHNIDEIDSLASRVIAIKDGKIDNIVTSSRKDISILDIKRSDNRYIVTVDIDGKIVELPYSKEII